MNSSIYVATGHGVLVCSQEAGEWSVVRRGLEDRSITSVTGWGDVVFAGTRDGIFCSTDQGETWKDTSSGLSLRHIRWLLDTSRKPVRVFAGTEPAGIFYTDNCGEMWQECPEAARLRDSYGWFLPYSPEAGCVRGFAFNGERGYAAVEVGGVLVTTDSGDSWQLAGGSSGSPALADPAPGAIHPDVHSIAVHPSSANRVFAPTGGGFYQSFDGGDKWTLLYPAYCRAVWIDPTDSQRMVLGPADGVSRGGRIEESRDGGKTWVLASSGLEVPWPRAMVERFTQAGGELLAVLSNGELFCSPLEQMEWRRILPDVNDVAAVAERAMD